MERPDNFTLVIFGASGDLTKRKLMPALFALYKQNLLSERFAVLGTSRSELSDEAFRERIIEGIKLYGEKEADENMLHSFSKNVYYLPFDAAKSMDYPKLKARLSKIDYELKIKGNYIYYLSTSPNLFPIIADSLGKEGLNKEENSTGWKRIVIEKPFGHDLESAKELNATLLKIFDESQVYRIDHYLGKETVQNILAFRFSNGIFEPLWNRNYVHHVEVTAAEHIGVEERGEYYDQYGALRDMVQNHLLNIVGIVAMEPPSIFDSTAVRNETVKVFQSLRRIRPEDAERYVVPGQYTESTIHGEKVPGYRNEKNIAQDSRTETFIALKLYIDNWRWGDVPFYIRTGKRLPTRVSEVVIHFKRTPHHLFTQNNLPDVRRNQLIIRIQPDEGILLKFGMKMPGAGFEIKDVNMDFHYSNLSNAHIPEAYERLLLDCMLGDATLYARTDAVETCWLFVDPILKAWKERQDIKIYGYPAGTWGPKEAHALFDNPDEDWRYPCKNLATDGEYCEF
jgi:glucose-6-phosphate 1-dehydrogenase